MQKEKFNNTVNKVSHFIQNKMKAVCQQELENFKQGIDAPETVSKWYDDFEALNYEKELSNTIQKLVKQFYNPSSYQEIEEEIEDIFEDQEEEFE